MYQHVYPVIHCFHPHFFVPCKHQVVVYVQHCRPVLEHCHRIVRCFRGGNA